MKRWIQILFAIMLASLIAGCAGGIDEGILADIQGGRAGSEMDDAANCPPPDGNGTVSPDMSIASLVFTVNDVTHTVRDGESLAVQPGDEVLLHEVTICVGSFSGDGGEACVDVVPTTSDEQEVGSEHQGSHLFALSAGIMTISNLDLGWTVREEWDGLSAVLNHWAPTMTEDLGCASGGCERDDWMKIAFE